MAEKKSKKKENYIDWTNAKDKVVQAKEKTSDFVNNHPWEAVALGVIAGIVIGAGITNLMPKKRSIWDILQDLY